MSDPRRLRTGLLVAGVGLAAAIALAVEWPSAFPRALGFWMVACLAGELLFVRLPVGGATLSMASCFNFAALLVLPRGEAMFATVVATLIGERLGLHKPAVRVVYNASHTALAVLAGSLVFEGLSGGSHDLQKLLAELHLGPLIGAGLAYYVVNRAAVVLAITSSDGVPPLAAWRENFGSAYEALSSGAVFSLGALLAIHFQGIGMVGTLFVALPLALACDGLRRYNERVTARSDANDGERRAA